MKKFLTIIFVSLGFTSAFAQENFYYCPDKIECATAGKLNSCKIVGGNPSDWPEMMEDGRIEAATYQLRNVAAMYQNPNRSGAECQYYYGDPSHVKLIRLMANTKLNLQAIVTDFSKWEIMGYSASCHAGKLSCPLAPYSEPKN